MSDARIVDGDVEDMVSKCLTFCACFLRRSSLSVSMPEQDDSVSVACSNNAASMLGIPSSGKMIVGNFRVLLRSFISYLFA